MVRTLWLIAAIMASQGVGQRRSVPLKPPFGAANGINSPDGAEALFGVARPSRLWLEDTSSHRRRLVFDVTVQTLSLAWSPDSAAFIANDREASDREHAYIYDVNTLGRLDLDRLILAADASAHRFVPGPDRAPHSYFHGVRWLDASHVEVRLHGHTDGWAGASIRPVECFDLRYRVDMDGAVEKRSWSVSAVTSKGCRGNE